MDCHWNDSAIKAVIPESQGVMIPGVSTAQYSSPSGWCLAASAITGESLPVREKDCGVVFGENCQYHDTGWARRVYWCSLEVPEKRETCRL